MATTTTMCREIKSHCRCRYKVQPDRRIHTQREQESKGSKALTICVKTIGIVNMR